MDIRAVVVVVAMLVGLSLALPARVSRKQALENAFNDRATVEAIIQCFLNKKTCTPEEKKIKDRAMATMKNFGVCPSNVCTAEERAEINRAMELLQRKHPDLWTKLIAAMFGIQV